VLKQMKLRDNTIVVFLSDNGPEPGQKAFASAGPYRGLKWSSLEGGTRVPCIISWPGFIPEGDVNDEIVSAVDLLPTLAHACGIQFEAGSPRLDGVNVWGSILGNAAKHPRKELLFWEGWATPQAIRVGDWKLYFDAVKGVPSSDEGPALFNLANDPGEQTNQAHEYPDKVAAMKKRARELLLEIERGRIDLGGDASGEVHAKHAKWLN